MLKTLFSIIVVGALSLPVQAQEPNNIEPNTLYKEDAAVVLPVFYVVNFDVEGYKIHTAGSQKSPTPTVVYAPKTAEEGDFSLNTVSPHYMLKKLTDSIDKQLDIKP